jgi:hypothetical protein
VLKIIRSNILIAQKNYELLSALLLGTAISLSECNSGYFCLARIPHALTDKLCRRENVAEMLIASADVLSIPHDRYLYIDDEFYCFRVNLSIASNELMLAFQRVLAWLDTSSNQRG